MRIQNSNSISHLFPNFFLTHKMAEIRESNLLKTEFTLTVF